MLEGSITFLEVISFCSHIMKFGCILGSSHSLLLVAHITVCLQGLQAKPNTLVDRILHLGIVGTGLHATTSACVVKNRTIVCANNRTNKVVAYMGLTFECILFHVHDKIKFKCRYLTKVTNTRQTYLFGYLEASGQQKS